MTVALERPATPPSALAPPPVLREGPQEPGRAPAGSRAAPGRLIDLSGVDAPRVVRRVAPPGRRLVADLGRDPDSPLAWQRVAEAVRAVQPGDCVIVDSTEAKAVDEDLVDFLRYACRVAQARGGQLGVEPAGCPLACRVRP